MSRLDERPPVLICVACGHQTDNCTCPGGAPPRSEQLAVVPDRAAVEIRSYLRAHPELQHDEYARRGDPLLGLCYPAAEAYYHVHDCTHDVFCLSWEEVDPEYSGTHWYLREPGAGRWIDLGLPVDLPMADLPPFGQGRRRAFMTGDDPSERTQQVLRGIGRA